MLVGLTPSMNAALTHSYAPDVTRLGYEATCRGLTAKPGTISPVWGLRTEMTSSLIFFPTNFCSSSPTNLMSALRICNNINVTFIGSRTNALSSVEIGVVPVGVKGTSLRRLSSWICLWISSALFHRCACPAAPSPLIRFAFACRRSGSPRPRSSPTVAPSNSC